MTVRYDDPVLYDDPGTLYNGRSSPFPDRLPLLTVEVSFDTDPGDPPSWIDISRYVQTLNIRRGRARFLDQMSAGVASIEVNNRDRRFDPTNTDSPYSPGVKLMRQVRVLATWNGTTYPMFRGFVRGWPQVYPHRSADSRAVIDLVDGFGALNLASVTESRPAEPSGARISALLDAAGWPASLRSIDTGQSTVQAVSYDRADALESILAVADTENGVFFIAQDGVATFVERHALIFADLDATRFLFGDGGTEQRYRNLEVGYDDDQLWTQVTVESEGLIPSTASDDDAQSTYFRRSYRRGGMLFTTENDQADAAYWLLARFKQPALLMSKMGISGDLDFGNWSNILLADVTTKARVRKRPMGGGPTIEQDSFVEGISWSIQKADRWDCVWDLSPVTGFSDYWVLDDSALSVLGTSTRPAY